MTVNVTSLRSKGPYYCLSKKLEKNKHESEKKDRHKNFSTVIIENFTLRYLLSMFVNLIF